MRPAQRFIVAHEYGHHLDDAMGGSTTPYARELRADELGVAILQHSALLLSSSPTLDRGSASGEDVLVNSVAFGFVLRAFDVLFRALRIVRGEPEEPTGVGLPSLEERRAKVALRSGPEDPGMVGVPGAVVDAMWNLVRPEVLGWKGWDLHKVWREERAD